jgi:hypothetical protein
MKQVGKNTVELCDCCWFDDGKAQALPRTLEAFTLKHEDPEKKSL